MRTAQLAGTHTLTDGTTADVTVTGRYAEILGTNTHGEASFSLILPVTEASALLSGATA